MSATVRQHYYSSFKRNVSSVWQFYPYYSLEMALVKIMIFCLKAKSQYNALSRHLKGSCFAGAEDSPHAFKMEGYAHIMKHELYWFQFK